MVIILHFNVLTLRLLDVQKLMERISEEKGIIFLVFVLFSFALQAKYHQIFATSTSEYKMCQTDAFRAWIASSAHFCSFESIHHKYFANKHFVSFSSFFFLFFYFSFKF